MTRVVTGHHHTDNKCREIINSTAEFSRKHNDVLNECISSLKFCALDRFQFGMSTFSSDGILNERCHDEQVHVQVFLSLTSCAILLVCRFSGDDCALSQ